MTCAYGLVNCRSGLDHRDTYGLKGLPEAIESVNPKTAVQMCVVHMARHSLNYVSWKMRKAEAACLRCIYGASTLEQAQIGERMPVK